MTISETIPIAVIVGGGLSLCISGFSQKGLPFSQDKRIAGRPAKVIGVVSLILSLVAAAVWVALSRATGAMGAP